MWSIFVVAQATHNTNESIAGTIKVWPIPAYFYQCEVVRFYDICNKRKRKVPRLPSIKRLDQIQFSTNATTILGQDLNRGPPSFARPT